MKWLKRLLFAFLFLLLVGGIIFFFFAGKIVDKQMNQSTLTELPKISEKAQKLHQTLNIADWHSDNLLWDRNILKRSKHGHVDLPKLLEGNVTLQVFDAVIKTPRGQNYNSNSDGTDNITLLAMGNRWHPKTWSSLCERAVYQSELLHKAEKKSNGQLKIVRTRSDLQNFLNARKSNNNQVAGMLSIEGLHALEGKLENVERLYNEGYRMYGLVHFFDNEVGGSSAGTKKGGLTDFGKQVIKKMEEKKILIDLAHASPKLIREVMKIATRPVVVSHTGVKGTHNSKRNLSDAELKMIANKGGMIGIGFWAGAVGSIQPSAIAKAMRYTANLVGIDHVCLGSDFDGSVKTYFNAAQLVVLTEALLKEGFTETEIHKIMGQNQIDFLLKYLPD